MNREAYEKEVREDLSKDEIHLMVDVYDEILHEDRPLGHRAIHAGKRFSALLGKSIIEASKASAESMKLQTEVRDMTSELVKMTRWLKILTWVMTVCTLVVTYVTVYRRD